MAHLLREHPDIWVSVSATTRPPRPGEVEGADYFFLDEEAFDRLVEGDAFLEWAEVHGYRYGTLRSVVEERMALGQQIILEIDIQGGFQVKKKMPTAHLVFIEPPSFTALEERLRKRGTETEDMIDQRMRTAKLELSRKMEYDIRLVNDGLDKAVSELASYIKKQADRE